MKSRSWFLLLIIDAIIDLLFVLVQHEEWRYTTKPLLLLLLTGYAFSKIKIKDKLFFLLSAGLFFSLSGDIFLMFERKASYWFIPGLIGFLIAHIFYIILFIQVRQENQSQKKFNIPVVLLTGAYTTFLYLLLKPTLGNLEIPVLIYAVVLSCMFISGFHAFDFSKQQAGRLCITGAALFVTSDSLLAINKFYDPFNTAGFVVMLTYDLAQLLIVLGISSYLNDLHKRRNNPSSYERA
ncbi:MAG TPA: lysoplasmalogenase [Puia sp.]|nr:lysoplasmalogenase [Puia sp.]